MCESQLKNLFNMFNYLSSNLIKAFTRNNLDEHSLLFLSKRTKHLLSFTHKVLIRLVFKFFRSAGKIKDFVDEDIVDTNQMIEVITLQINQSLDDLISQKVDEKRQRDIDDIVENLTFLKDIINSLSNFFLSIVKVQSDIIDDDEFIRDYRKFKYDLTINKDKINKKINNMQ